MAVVSSWLIAVGVRGSNVVLYTIGSFFAVLVHGNWRVYGSGSHWRGVEYHARVIMVNTLRWTEGGDRVCFRWFKRSQVDVFFLQDTVYRYVLFYNQGTSVSLIWGENWSVSNGFKIDAFVSYASGIVCF